ncbi:MAG TPA: Caa(3)-type oxidase subunit IV [Casimicrobiaceae bacterium]|nr:Caa(3)-type oxidase subunit IV [Casimicrobiaceae bacterium]
MSLPHLARLNTQVIRVNALTWVALLVLLALTCGSAFLRLGPWNVVINFGIAVIKAALVVLVFMKLTKGAMTIQIVAGLAVVTLAILALLSGTDFWFRY